MRLASFETIAKALESADVRYLVAGGLAVNAHGILRFTKDIDLVKPLHAAIPVRFVSLRTLIEMKQQAGRPQDLADIEQLRMRLDEDSDA